MAFTPETFVLCSKFNLFKAHANLWIYSTADTLEDCLEPDYFQPRRNIKNQDSPEVGDVIQLIVENSKIAYVKIVAKTEKPYNITVARTFLENEEQLLAAITDLQLSKADKTTDFVTPITEENLGLTQAEQTELEEKIDLAANSGRMITAQGFWYAKMHSETVAPSAEDDTNYADFSQVDGEGNPIIVTYNRVSGAWVQDQTITPPAEFDGYVPITSKIWDITEQDGQQGGRILWNHVSKQFTPYPTIVAFDSIEITGNSTVEMPQNPSDDNIANVGFVKNTVGAARNIGDIFYTSRKDTQLNGAVACDGSTYNTSDFTGSGSIGELLALSKIPYVSLSTYATNLSNNGSVGVFGWDGIGTTEFRVPFLDDVFVESEKTVNSVGAYTKPGLPAFQGSMEVVGTSNVSGCVKRTSPSGNAYDRDDTGGEGVLGTYTIKGSDSSAIYGRSSTVQPASIKYRAMVQIATGSTDQALETCTGVIADVANLKDLSNLTSTGKEKAANLAMPSDTYDDLTLSASGTTYTAPADGYVGLGIAVTAANQYVDIFYVSSGVHSKGYGNNNGDWATAIMPVSKGQQYTIQYNAAGAVKYFKFIYAKGAL